MGRANALPWGGDPPLAVDPGRPTGQARGMGIAIGVIALLSGLVAAGCGGETAAPTPVHRHESTQATVHAFVATLEAGRSSSYVATYTTGGTSRGTVVYAAGPAKAISFTDTPSTGSPYRIIDNGSGELVCSRSTSNPGSWSCQKLSGGVVTVKARLDGYYSASHWITFLQQFSLAATLPGDQATTWTSKVHGLDVECIELRAVGVPGATTLCATKKGIPAYVSVATNPDTFVIEHLDRSPSPSLFATP